jgi:prepilin-type N-terminal cleavage/methylation domain-containing protein
MTPRIQKAFTLVELLVVITIIGMLVALLLPAVNAARAAGQKAKCQNNLRELGHAVLEYTTAHDYFPGYRQPLTMSTATGSSKIVVNWQVVLLPNLGRNDLYQALQGGALTQFPYLEISVCPSDSSAVGTTGSLTAWTSYVANTGRLDLPVVSGSAVTVCVADSPNPSTPSPETSADGIFLDRVLAPNAKVTLTDIKDGQSTTLMLAENIDAAFYNDGAGSDSTGPIILNPNNNLAAWKAQLDAAHNCTERGCGFVWWDTSPSSSSNPPAAPNDPPTIPSTQAAQIFKINGKAGDYDPVRVNWPSTPYDMSTPSGNTNTNFAARPAGPHSGGVVVVFAAGNTKFQRDDIDYSVYCLLMTPNGANAPTKSQFSSKSWQQWKTLNEGSL